MKNTLVSFIIALGFVATNAAQARSCPANFRHEILSGLQSLSRDAFQSEEKQQQAVFAASLIIHGSILSCDFNSGFVGSVYDLETATHRIHVSFAGKAITNLEIERISFNQQ
jgi:hypothetical protein